MFSNPDWWNKKLLFLLLHSIHNKIIIRHRAKIHNTGFPPYLENLEFCHFLFQAWKMPGICSKSSKNLEFLLKTLKKLEICKLYVSSFTFQNVIYKNNSDLHLVIAIYIINTNIVIRSQIDRGFHCFYLEIIWKIHGIFVTREVGSMY